MITANDLLSFVHAMRWPAVVLVLGIVFLVRFTPDISELLKRLRKGKLPGGTELSFGYGEVAIDKATELPSAEVKAKPVAKAEQPKENTIIWSNTGNLFWAAHDLMWTIDVLLRGGPRASIVRNLTQSLHQVRSLGFGGTPIESRLAKLKDIAESSREQDWTALRRRNYTREVASLIWDIGQQAAAHQPDYEPKPKG